MNRSIFLVRIGCAALISAGIFAHAEPVEQRYKNIQVLKGAEAKELIPAMDFIRGALGVDCFYCHSSSGRFPEGYEKDDLRAKQVAREMIRMMKQINETSFHGRQVVTCTTCHNGHARPQGATTIAAPAALKEAFAAKPPSAARAGEAALSKLTTRHVVASVTAANGLVTKVESFYKASGDLFWQQTAARTPVVMGFDGTNAFRASGGDVRTLNDSDAEEIHLVGLFYRNLRPKTLYGEARTVSKEKLDDKAVYMVRGALKVGRYIDLLSFDLVTGFLLRRMTLTPTLLGQSAQTTDFENYRDVDGIKVSLVSRL